MKETFKPINEASLLNMKDFVTNFSLICSESHSSLTKKGAYLSHKIECKTCKVTCGALRCSVNDGKYNPIPVDIKDEEWGHTFII